MSSLLHVPCQPLNEYNWHILGFIKFIFSSGPSCCLNVSDLYLHELLEGSDVSLHEPEISPRVSDSLLFGIVGEEPVSYPFGNFYVCILLNFPPLESRT